MKRKVKIRELSEGRSYSLQDVSDELNVPKNVVYDTAKEAGMSIGLVFNKYTVFSKEQVDELRELLSDRRAYGR